MSNLGHLGLVEGFGDQEGRFDGHNRTRCVRICVRHGPVPAAHLGVFRGFSTVRQGSREPHSLLAVRPAGCGILTAMPSPPGGFEVPLWRALAVFRLASLAYVCALAVRNADRYAHPFAVGALVLLMIAWTGCDGDRVRPTGLAALAAAAGRPRRWCSPSCWPRPGWSAGRRWTPACPPSGWPGWPARCWPGRSPAGGGGARSPRCWSAARTWPPGSGRPVLDHRGDPDAARRGRGRARGPAGGERRGAAAAGRGAGGGHPGAGAAGPGHPRLGAPGAGAGPAARRRPRRRGRRAGPAGRRAGGRAACADRRHRPAPRAPDGGEAVDLRTLLGGYASAAVALAAPATPVPLPAGGGRRVGRGGRRGAGQRGGGTPAGGPGCWSRTRGRR